jgi:hypothetical protein
MASDGGAVDKLGSYGALLATHEHILVECGGSAQGSNPRSFQAEGYGILAVLRLVFHLCYYYVTRNAALRFRLYCDSESLLKRIAASRALTRTLPRRFLFSELSQVSLVSVGHQTIMHHIPTQLRTFTGMPGMRAHYCHHHEWEPPAIFDLVDWPRFHGATLTTTFLTRLFVTKWVNSLLPFQQQQHLYKQSPSAQCPSACGCASEDWRHFPHCPHPQRIQAWDTFLLTLASLMERWQLDPSLRRIVLHLLAPLTSSPPIPLDNLKDEYHMLLLQQRSIGVDSVLFGFFATEWVYLQDRYLHALGLPSSKHEATRSIQSLILACHDQCHAVWLLRNQHLQGTDPHNTTTSFKHLHLLVQIQELYDARPHMMAHDRDIFAYPMDSRHLQSTPTLQAFYQHAKPIAEKSIADALKIGWNFRPIDVYFRPLIPQAIFDIILGL